MTLEERFTASSKNITRTRYNRISQQIQDHSDLNIDTAPNRYNLQTKLDIDRSRLNIDTNPDRYNTAGRIASAGDTSRYNIDTTPTKYHP